MRLSEIHAAARKLRDAALKHPDGPRTAIAIWWQMADKLDGQDRDDAYHVAEMAEKFLIFAGTNTRGR